MESTDAAPGDRVPIGASAPESAVTPTRICPCCGAGRMIVVAEIPPIAPAAGIPAALGPCLIFDSS